MQYPWKKPDYNPKELIKKAHQEERTPRVPKRAWEQPGFDAEKEAAAFRRKQGKKKE